MLPQIENVNRSGWTTEQTNWKSFPVCRFYTFVVTTLLLFLDRGISTLAKFTRACLRSNSASCMMGRPSSGPFVLPLVPLLLPTFY
jgi:hypothetical protein